MFADFKGSEFFWMLSIVSLAIAHYAGNYAGKGAHRLDVGRLRRLEAKADLILRHLGLEYIDPATPGGLSEEVKALADDPARKVEAIILHRKQTGVGLSEAKDAVESYMDRRGRERS